MHYLFIPYSIIAILFGYIFITKTLHLYQLNSYKIITTYKTLYAQTKVGDALLYLVSALLFYLLYFLVDNYVFRIVWISLFYLLFFIYVINFLPDNSNLKTPLRYTRRVVRFLIIYLVCFFIIYMLIFLGVKNDLFYFTLFNTFYIVGILVFALTHLICIPIEKCVYLFYLNRAKAKLSSNSQLLKIGITGSYGKTSTKFILHTILSEKYFVLSTPNSYNTPMGITKTVLSELNNNHQVFIMEMGANKVGDIKYLCKVFKPQIGILTSIGNCHMQSFKTPQNIINTKCELQQNLHNPKLMVFNAEDKRVNDCSKKYKLNKKLIGVGQDLYADNVVVTTEGCIFDIICKNEFYAKVTTKLLGEHNVLNILLCVAVAIELGLSKQQIIRGISKLAPVKNRLELVNYSSGLTVLNDAYNSNSKGCEVALKTLAKFTNKNKIVITCGMVELGAQQYKDNYRFAKQIAGVADKVYIVNNINKSALQNGLFDAGFDFNNYKFVSRFNKIDFSKFTKDDVVLIENDLPDNYD